MRKQIVAFYAPLVTIEYIKVNFMLITSFLILLLIVFSIHIRFLVRYVIDKKKKYLRGYLFTSVLNILIAMCLSVLVMMRPELLVRLDYKKMLWLMSGVILVVMLFVKISILKKIYQRCQLPENYHFNFFGKKVLHPSVVKQYEIVTFFVTIPIFLLIGAYFVARLINWILYGHL